MVASILFANINLIKWKPLFPYVFGNELTKFLWYFCYHSNPWTVGKHQPLFEKQTVHEIIYNTPQQYDSYLGRLSKNLFNTCNTFLVQLIITVSCPVSLRTSFWRFDIFIIFLIGIETFKDHQNYLFGFSSSGHFDWRTNTHFPHVSWHFPKIY